MAHALRIATLQRHVGSSAAIRPAWVAAATEPTLSEEDVRRLNLVLDRHHLDVRQEVYSMLAEPLFALDYTKSMYEQQDLTWRRIHRIAELKRRFVEEPLADSAAGECLYYYDLSLIVRIGAHFGLWGGSVRNLGTERHHRELLPDILSLKLPGCFALTELGHGSNARAMETTATYDAATQEFVIHTPTESAQKYLIGNGMTARMGVVFAQLHVGGQCHGLHAFVVPLRDAAGRLLPGVRAAECGLKIGLNGVDNGRFWFSHARVPRAALLNRFADVTPDGRYASKLPSPAMRFAATISALVTGRVSMTLGANNIAKLAVATAVLYGQQRRQFGPPGAPEVPLLDYTIHQSRLMPHLARCLVTSCAAQRLKRLAAAAAAGGGGADAAASRARLMKMLHVAVSGLKAVVTWHMRDALTDCREACGGQGFKADNRVGVARADADAWMTFEGDNFVLLQQVAQEQLKRLQRGVAGQGAAGEELAHLRAEAALQPALRRLAAAMGGDAGVPLDAPDVAGACAALAADPLSQAQQQRALRVLEGDALLRLALRLAQLHRDGRAAWDAWNEAGAEAVECGRAFALRWLLDAYCDDMRELAAVAGGAGGDPLYPRQAGEAAQAPRVTEALALARSVFVLHALLREPAFLRRQFVDAAGLERMSVTLQALQQQLRRHAVPCVRAFGIPQHLLPPIAKDYVAQYSYESARRATEFSGAARE